MKTNYARFILLTLIILFVKTFINAQTPPDETYNQNPFGGNLVLSSAYCQPYDSSYYEEEDYTEWYYDWNYVWRIEVPQNTPIKFEYTKNTNDYFEIYTTNVNGYRQFVIDYSPGNKTVTAFSSDGFIYIRASTCYWGEPPTGNIFNMSFVLDSNFTMTNGSYNSGNTIVNGKLGIGTVAPTEKLEVIGNAKVSHKFAVGTSPYSSSKFSLYNNTENTSQTIYNYKNTTNSTYGINISASNSSGNVYGLYSSVSGQTGKKWAGYFTGGDVAVVNGNVGIGMDNPQGALQVRGTYDNSWIYFNPNAGMNSTKYKPKVNHGMAFTWNYSGGHGESIINYSKQTGSSPRLDFTSYDGTNLITEMTLKNGRLGIGTTTPDSLLTVKGGIHARSVVIDFNVPLADYVFDPTYNLMPLTQVEQFVNTNKHLPSIPSATEVQEKGMNMGEMQNKLLQKIEELTLYVIQQQKEIDALREEIKRK